MKRHLVFMFLLVLELVYSIGYILGYHTFYLLLITNILVFIVLLFEPYWKIGAWLIYFTSSEVFLYLVNIAIFRKLVFVHSILNVVTVFGGLIIITIAYLMKLREKPALIDSFNYDENRSNEIPKDFIEEKPKKIETRTFLAAKDIVHKKDCEIVKKAKDARIVNERYAKAMGLKACEECKPY